MPRVSICVPNLNGRRFLAERLDTILAQTFRDWELIAADSYSDDGSWELLQDYARRDARLRLLQCAREGVYAGINACIRAARGEYVYIATSDDTMTPACIEQLVGGLDAHPECGLAHCGLRVIDEQGRDVAEEQRWPHYPAPRYFGALNAQAHVRFAPHDGLLHFAVLTVYTSLTQLLIRRRVFDRVGLFDTQFGSMGDFEWGARASLVENTLHIPAILATWRLHAAQVTADVHTARSRRRLQRMACLAFRRAARIAPPLLRPISLRRLRYPYDRDYLALGLRERPTRGAKLAFLLTAGLARAGAAFELVRLRLRGQAFEPHSQIDWMRAELRRLGIPAPRAVDANAA